MAFTYNLSGFNAGGAEMLLNYTCKHIKFVKYTGQYPNLCNGVLILNIDGKLVSFGKKRIFGNDSEYDCFWETGGSCNLYDGCTTGEWQIDANKLPKQYKKYAHEIDKVFNQNVEFGCCGGCR